MAVQLLIDELEDLTESIVRKGCEPGKCDTKELLADLQQRTALIGQLSEALRSSPPLSYPEYNRLIIIQAQGQKIQASLEQMRGLIAAEMSGFGRDRMYADRLASQLPDISPASKLDRSRETPEPHNRHRY